ncbi:hypothetical protein CDD83_3036 [Cordyceps sp. RAO-2017]|nr:hypothetical protein CDD83_3036 [Cordyceps sp. RAO-2017]
MSMPCPPPPPPPRPFFPLPRARLVRRERAAAAAAHQQTAVAVTRTERDASPGYSRPHRHDSPSDLGSPAGTEGGRGLYSIQPPTPSLFFCCLVRHETGSPRALFPALFASPFVLSPDGESDRHRHRLKQRRPHTYLNQAGPPLCIDAP